MPLKLYRRGNIWWIRGTVNGERIRQSTRTGDKKKAQRIASEVENRTWQGHFDGPASVVTFENAAALYLQAQKPERFIFDLVDYWRSTPLKDITPGHIRQAALALYPTQSNATRNRHVIVPAQAVVNHAAELELCQRIHIKRFPVETKEKTPITWDWVQAFMAHANPHLGALACFMFCTGARISEALAVQWEDVDLVNRRALIRQTKISDERWAHLPPELFEAIANIEGERLGKVFKYSSRSTAKVQWNAAIKTAGVEKLSFHCCRHGFATSLLQAGVDPVTVAKRGGWKSAQHVFQTYGHAMDDETVTDLLTGTKRAHTYQQAAEK